MIAEQPQAIAYQIFDQKTIHLLQPRYSSGSPIVADTLTELAGMLKINSSTLEKTIAQFNESCPKSGTFDPNNLDGLSTNASLEIPKSNWAQPIDKSPFVAHGVTCGITFTYGGVASDTKARVLNNEGNPMPDLYCAGEIAGGVLYHNTRAVLD